MFDKNTLHQNSLHSKFLTNYAKVDSNTELLT